MQAIVYRDYGDPGVLEFTERPRPDPARDEVRIAVVAAGVNPIDARLRSGEMKWLLPGGFPRIPGYDVAGTVEAVGSESEFAVGDRVLAFLDHLYGGGYAEFAVCSADCVARLPDDMPFEEAAGLPLAGSTALQSLRDHSNLAAGERLLVNGASGGVGALAVRIAVADGATVTGVASEKHEAFVLEQGATEFLDYERTDFTTLDRQWDVIFDAAGKSSYGMARRVLAEGGRFVSTEPSLRGLIVSLVTWPLDRSGRVMLARSRGGDLRELLRRYEAGTLPITIAETFPLKRAAEAHRRLERDSFPGKLVLRTGTTA